MDADDAMDAVDGLRQGGASWESCRAAHSAYNVLENAADNVGDQVNELWRRVSHSAHSPYGYW